MCAVYAHTPSAMHVQLHMRRGYGVPEGSYTLMCIQGDGINAWGPITDEDSFLKELRWSTLYRAAKTAKEKVCILLPCHWL